MKNYSLHSRIFLIAALHLLITVQPLLSQTVKLKLIETSDVHGSLFPWDFINDKPANTSLAQVYTYVEEQRADKSQSVILLDNGDILQGQPLVYYYNFEDTKSEHICASVMNYMKYDAATVGNHDIEPGHPVYDKLNKEFKFPWMAANAVDTKTGEPYFKPYTILNRNGVKIAVLGLITPGIPMWLPEKIWSGIDFQDMIVSAKKWVEIINEKEHPDVLIGVFHAGVEAIYDGQTADMPRNENAAQLVAERVPGFDVVFVGHDHHGWNYTVKDPEGNSVLILGTLNASRTATEATIVLNKNAETGIWRKETSGDIVQIENFKPDSAFMTEFESVIRNIKAYVAKPIGEFTKTISTRESLFGDSPFVDLIQHIQLELTHADVSFAAPLSFNAEIKKGEVYVRDMFKLYKFENLLYTMKMSGQEIKDYLEFSYGQWFNQMKNEEDDLLNFNHDEKGNLIYGHGTPQLAAAYYNYSSAAGINYTVDVRKHAGNRISITSMADGKPFDFKKTYTVAMNSYRGNGGGGHLTQGAKIPKEEIAGRIINSTPKDLRFYLMRWIEKEKTVTPKKLNNWSVIPLDWWEKGKEKDAKLLFKEMKTN
jgi:2',3'-cyclic-nucleotide 2'-phosphodiesterase/3'-nucleotidase